MTCDAMTCNPAGGGTGRRSRPLPVRLVLAALLAGLAAVPAAPMPAARAEAPAADTGGAGAHVAGRFDYYTLALSWSPTFCADYGHDGDPQCTPHSPRPYAFVLHGLWPQYERGWPQDCPIGQRPFVPRPLINRMLDIMPSPRLVIHEYRKHGTCSGLDPDGYFDLSRQLYEKITIPARYVRPPEPQYVSPEDLIREFLSANPALKPGMLSVVCGTRGNRLREVRICFTKTGEFRLCGENETRRKLCRASRMFVPPVRAGHAAAGEPGKADGPQAVSAPPSPAGPLPAPRFKEAPPPSSAPQP